MVLREFGELKEFRYLIFLLVRRDIINRYRRSALGLLWAILHPLIYMSILNFVFSYAFKRDDSSFTVYILTGVLFWMFFSGSTASASVSLSNRAGLIKKNRIKKNVFVYSAVLSAGLNWLLGIITLFIVIFALGLPLTPHLLVLPLVMGVTVLYASGIGMALAVYCAEFKDIQLLYTASLTLLMYLTPIFYPVDIIPERFLWIYQLNPNLYFINSFRYAFFESGYQLEHVGVATAIALVVYACGLWVFNRRSGQVVFYL